jgi:hypothetical protein
MMLGLPKSSAATCVLTRGIFTKSGTKYLLREPA